MRFVPAVRRMAQETSAGRFRGDTTCIVRLALDSVGDLPHVARSNCARRQHGGVPYAGVCLIDQLLSATVIVAIPLALPQLPVIVAVPAATAVTVAVAPVSALATSSSTPSMVATPESPAGPDSLRFGVRDGIVAGRPGTAGGASNSGSSCSAMAGNPSAGYAAALAPSVTLGVAQLAFLQGARASCSARCQSRAWVAEWKSCSRRRRLTWLLISRTSPIRHRDASASRRSIVKPSSCRTATMVAANQQRLRSGSHSGGASPEPCADLMEDCAGRQAALNPQASLQYITEHSRYVLQG